MTYNPGIPTPTQNLSVSQGLLKDNFTAADNSFGTNHFPFSDLTANNGLHRDINQFKRVGNAPNLTDTYTLFTKDYTPDTTGGTADTQLFGVTGAGGVSQFSGNLATADGWAWVGGVLLQWGFVTDPNITNGTANGTVTFKDRVTGAIPFPNNCFVVIGTNTYSVLATGTRTASLSISKAAGGVTKDKFDWSFNGSSGAATGFFWYAIGN